LEDFKGLDDWIEIFKGGKQIDSQGREHNGDEIIDRAIETFDTAEHEPPVVIGHPKDNAPAFGWIEDLKSHFKGGVKVLLAKLKQVAPEFEDIVKNGLFKKRSASFYKDGRLRHVGFLGAEVPAVKGLVDIQFNDGDSTMNIDFVSSSDPGEELERLISVALKNPPKTDQYGRPIEGEFTYRDAFEFVARENPELTQEYIKTLK